MLNEQKLRQLATQIFRFFHGLDKPAADEIQIPLKAIKQDKDNKDTYYATVRYYINWNGMIFQGKKQNEVRIKFDVDQNGKFLPKTWAYA